MVRTCGVTFHHARQGKARQGKAGQGKARQGKAGQGRAWHGKARQAKPGQAAQAGSPEGRHTRQRKATQSRHGKAVRQASGHGIPVFKIS